MSGEAEHTSDERVCGAKAPKRIAPPIALIDLLISMATFAPLGLYYASFVPVACATGYWLFAPLGLGNAVKVGCSMLDVECSMFVFDANIEHSTSNIQRCIRRGLPSLPPSPHVPGE